MEKLLFVATHPQQSIGYSKIANQLSNYLCNYYYLHYFAFQNFIDTKVEDREISSKITLYDAFELDPSSNSGFGDNALIKLYDEIEPDIVFVYNDVMVCNAVKTILMREDNKNKKIPKFVCYLDIVYPFERKEVINKINENYDLIITFTDFWKNHLRDKYSIDENKLMTLYHGCQVKPLDKKECKEKLGLNEDDYLVVNINRNSQRKCIDIAITGFINWIKNKENKNKYKLFLGGHPNSMVGYDYKAVIEAECLSLGLNSREILDNLILSYKPCSLSDEEINIVNNAADIVMNVSSGEGFGLCSVEGMLLGKKLLCSELPVYDELLKTYPTYCKIKMERHLINNERITGIEYITSKEEIAYKLELCYNSKEANDKTLKRLRTKFNWENIFDDKKIIKYIAKL